MKTLQTKGTLSLTLPAELADKSEDSDLIDFKALTEEDFLGHKDDGNVANRKLKEFYKRHTEESNVSLFTMIENAR